MSKLKKKKIKKAIARRAKSFEKYRVKNAWRNIFCTSWYFKVKRN
nr:DUF3983 domain-containing protein [Bacillus mycoides]